MPKLDQNERNQIARDSMQIACDLNWAAIVIMSDQPVFGILYIKGLEARAKTLFEKLKAEAAD